MVLTQKLKRVRYEYDIRELIKERYSSEVAEEIIENLDRPQQAFYFLKYTPNHERYSKNVKV